MKALTVQQPWAWAIIHGGKDVENRTQAWSYRGPLAIHAGQRLSDRGLRADVMQRAWLQHGYGYEDDLIDVTWEASTGPGFATGAVIGTVDLVDVHTAAEFCCDSIWGEQSYDEHGGRTRRDIVHLVLEHPQRLTEPAWARGSLGLWDLSHNLTAQVEAALP